jgi:hypothetical protein
VAGRVDVSLGRLGALAHRLNTAPSGLLRPRTLRRRGPS